MDRSPHWTYIPWTFPELSIIHEMTVIIAKLTAEGTLTPPWEPRRFDSVCDKVARAMAQGGAEMMPWTP